MNRPIARPPRRRSPRITENRMTQTLTPMFPEAAPVLARLLPEGEARYLGLSASFCDLHAFLRHLHDSNWYGCLHVGLGEQNVYVLVFEGRIIAASSGTQVGELALGEMLQLFTAGAVLNAYQLDQNVTHALAGVSSRVWKVTPTDNFSGVLVEQGSCILMMEGKVLGRFQMELGETGVFPAPLRPQTLILPKPLAGWAHQQYPVTLRGRDALSPITPTHQNFRKHHGQQGVDFLRSLGQDLTPAEYSLRNDIPLHDLEPLIQNWLKDGFIKNK